MRSRDRSSLSNVYRTGVVKQSSYCFHNRRKAAHQRGDRTVKRRRWMHHVQSMLKMSKSELSAFKCFSSFKFLKRLNKNRPKKDIKPLIEACNITLRAVIHTLKTSVGHYHYDGSQVCSTFLSVAFCMSRDLQCST